MILAFSPSVKKAATIGPGWLASLIFSAHGPRCRSPVLEPHDTGTKEYAIAFLVYTVEALVLEVLVLATERFSGACLPSHTAALDAISNRSQTRRGNLENALEVTAAASQHFIQVKDGVLTALVRNLLKPVL